MGSQARGLQARLLQALAELASTLEMACAG